MTKEQMTKMHGKIVFIIIDDYIKTGLFKFGSYDKTELDWEVL